MTLLAHGSLPTDPSFRPDFYVAAAAIIPVLLLTATLQEDYFQILLGLVRHIHRVEGTDAKRLTHDRRIVIVVVALAFLLHLCALYPNSWRYEASGMRTTVSGGSSS
jgi:hypothetical protein